MKIFNFIKKIFKTSSSSLEKEEYNKVTVNDKIDSKEIKNNKQSDYSFSNINLQENNNNKNYSQNNYNNDFLISNNQDNYLESEQLIKLKYLNTNKNKQEENINSVDIKQININELNTIWDLLNIKEDTQAEHIINSIPSDKWITMDEIRHNIKLKFNVEYSNEKSLYPYLKTLTDINLIKLNNIGKKRTWKKNIIIIKKE